MRRHKLPHYNPNSRKGWSGGDSHTLYAFRDKRTGHVVVHPGRSSFSGCGPECDVAIATREQAEEHYQSPLNAGWKVREQYEIGSESHRYKQLLGSVTRKPHFLNFEADSLVMEIGRAYRNKRITDEERELLAAFLDARRG